MVAVWIRNHCTQLHILYIHSWPAQFPIQWVQGALSPGVKRPGREADHSPPLVLRSRMRCYISTPPIRLHGVVLT
jgi:hypothetical protein